MILKYYAFRKAILKTGKCILGRSYILIHCHPRSSVVISVVNTRDFPAPRPPCSADTVRPPAARAANFLKAVTYILLFLRVPGFVMLDHFKSRVRKVNVKVTSSHSPHLFISLAKTSFITIYKTTGVLD